MGNKDDFLDELLGARRRGTAKNQPDKAAQDVSPQGGQTEPAPKGKDALDSLLGNFASKGRTKDAPEDPAIPGKRETGLTPLDLLTLPNDQRRLVNWLSRAKQATLQEMQQAVGKDTETTKSLIDALNDAGYLNEAVKDGQIIYRVAFRGQVRRGPVGLPGEIWARVDLDHVTFLKQLTLFRGLNEDQIREVSTMITDRRYQRDEVVIWQGNVSDYIFLIKSGIVGITRFSAQAKDRKALAYLKQGDILGEYGILPDQSGVASATATALSTVDALAFRRADFMAMLSKYSSVAIELSRILVQRLIATDSHFSSAMGTRLVLVIGTSTGVGTTTIGNVMTMTLAKMTQKKTVYTEQPEPHRLMPVFNVSPGVEVVRHQSGYDVLLATGSTGLPPTVRATLVVEQMLNNYENIVIGVPSWAEEVISYVTSYANQIIVVSSPTPEAQIRLNEVREMLKTLVHPERVTVFYVLNHPVSEAAPQEVAGRFDYEFTSAAELRPVAETMPENLPDDLARFASTLADRLGRTNQVSVYIPTTIDVNTVVDTVPYVERTLAFLGQRFGGATASQASGVWNSAEAGLVGESIHIVRSYATQTDLEQYMQEILDYVEGLKGELRQEAMALEINQKLMLI